jgi:hypothetical protein
MNKRNPVDFVFLPKNEKKKLVFQWFKDGESRSSIAWTLKISLPTITRWLSQPEPKTLQTGKNSPEDNIEIFLAAFPGCKQTQVPGMEGLWYMRPNGKCHSIEKIKAQADIEKYIKSIKK